MSAVTPGSQMPTECTELASFDRVHWTWCPIRAASLGHWASLRRARPVLRHRGRDRFPGSPRHARHHPSRRVRRCRIARQRHAGTGRRSDADTGRRRRTAEPHPGPRRGPQQLRRGRAGGGPPGQPRGGHHTAGDHCAVLRRTRPDRRGDPGDAAQGGEDRRAVRGIPARKPRRLPADVRHHHDRRRARHQHRDHVDPGRWPPRCRAPRRELPDGE